MLSGMNRFVHLTSGKMWTNRSESSMGLQQQADSSSTWLVVRDGLSPPGRRWLG